MGYITLFSDFGLQDASVAIAKGILMQHIPLNSIIDITHEVQPFNVSQAAYLFGSSYKNFPAGTCHLVLFDIFSAPNPRLVLSEHNGHYFLSPDNELLAASIDEPITNSWLCMELQKTHSFHNWLHRAGEVIGMLQNGSPEQIGLPATQLANNQPHSQDPVTKAHNVIHIDQFGNAIINFTRKEYERMAPGKKIKVSFIEVEHINEVKENYNDVWESYKLCRFNSNGYLEICLNHGKAASIFGLKLGGKHNNIQISFS